MSDESENNSRDQSKKDLVPDWSNIDATSFYRSAGGSEEKAPPKSFEQLTKETDKFLWFIVGTVVIIFVVAMLTKL